MRMKFVEGFHSISLGGLEFQADEKGVVDIPADVWASRDASVKFPLFPFAEEEVKPVDVVDLGKPAELEKPAEPEKVSKKKRG